MKPGRSAWLLGRVSIGSALVGLTLPGKVTVPTIPARLAEPQPHASQQFFPPIYSDVGGWQAPDFLLPPPVFFDRDNGAAQSTLYPQPSFGQTVGATTTAPLTGDLTSDIGSPTAGTNSTVTGHAANGTKVIPVDLPLATIGNIVVPRPFNDAPLIGAAPASRTDNSVELLQPRSPLSAPGSVILPSFGPTQVSVRAAGTSHEFAETPPLSMPAASIPPVPDLEVLISQEPAAAQTALAKTDERRDELAESSASALPRSADPPLEKPPGAGIPPSGAAALQQTGQPDTDLTPGKQTFPVEEGAALFSYNDELILQLRVTGTPAADTIIAYGPRSGVYLPLGELARLLDLAIQVSDDGNYAAGWFLSEERTLRIDLRQKLIETSAGSKPIDPLAAQAFEGELFLRADVFAELLPLEIETDLRSQAVILTTLEPFPFEERMRRRTERDQLNSRANRPAPEKWPREETPWALFSVPIADVELRTVSDTARGIRAEADVRLAGDVGFLTAQTFFSGTTQDGLTAAIVELGRRDVDGDLLGPLEATEFLLGDVATRAMPTGLRGISGRGLQISNQAFDGISVFDEINFRGVLPDGYEVELYRNDILLNSTRERVNGQYEFLQIPVDFGLNVFRLVFYGPQGQRREEVRRISVGDGRLAPGAFEYSAGLVQRGVNLLGVQGPDFRPDTRFGDWQSVAEVSYGFNRDITGNASAAYFEQDGQQRWIASAGVRTGLGGLALRGDVGAAQGGGRAIGVGIGGRALGGGFRLTHFEYSGPFVDEVRAAGTEPLSRATELDFNSSLGLGGDLNIPIALRGSLVSFQDGRSQANAAARASVRLPGVIASSTLNYSEFSSPGLEGSSQLTGTFDLATFNRSATQIRGSLGFRVHPGAAITQVGAQVSHAIDDDTVVRGTAAYVFEDGSTIAGLSAIREFDKFTLALDGQYDFQRKDHSVALRLSFSLGRDPLRENFFLAKPGLASSGAVAARAFQDRDGDQVFSDGDIPLPDVVISSANATAQTDADGFARLGELGNGNRAVIQVDPSSLPNIFMAPVSRGKEIVPRAGRFHVTQFPIIELSEVEGTVTFRKDSGSRGVSGLRLQMRDEDGELTDFVRTERDGYFFFERVKPGTYAFLIEPEQAQRLNLCLAPTEPIVISQPSDIISIDLSVGACVSLPQA